MAAANLVFFLFFRAAPAAYEGPRLGIKQELQLPAYTTAGATPDLWRLWPIARLTTIPDPDPLSEARIELSSLWLLVGFFTTEPRLRDPTVFPDLRLPAKGRCGLGQVTQFPEAHFPGLPCTRPCPRAGDVTH